MLLHEGLLGLWEEHLLRNSIENYHYDDSVHDDSGHVQGREDVAEHTLLLPECPVVQTLNELLII